jgi:hypothetical protein
MTDNGHFDRETRTSDMEVVETAVLEAGWVANLMKVLRRKVPTGYEDESGFHFGAEPRQLG